MPQMLWALLREILGRGAVDVRCRSGLYSARV